MNASTVSRCAGAANPLHGGGLPNFGNEASGVATQPNTGASFQFSYDPQGLRICGRRLDFEADVRKTG